MNVQIKLVSVIEQGAFGVLIINGIPCAVTLWRTFEATINGYHMVITPGKYKCKRDWYNKGGYATFEILVKDHDRVLFHIGNLEDDSLGCVLIGEEFGMLDSKPAILRSGKAMVEFMNHMKGIDEFELEVTYAG